MTQQITIPRATLEQLVGALDDADDYLADCDIPEDRKVRANINMALTAGRAALEGAERVEREPTFTTGHCKEKQMSDLKEAAMRKALYALEEATTYTSSPSWSPSMTWDCESAIKDLRTALAQHPDKWTDDGGWEFDLAPESDASPCIYGQTDCTAYPMDCQCAIDAILIDEGKTYETV